MQEIAITADLNSAFEEIKELLRDNKTPKAHQLSEDIIRRHPKDYSAILNHAIVSLADLRLSEAIEYATKAYLLDKNSIRPFNLISRALIMGEDFHEALKYASKALELAPQDAEAQLLIGIASSKLKIHLNAEVWLRRAIDSNCLTSSVLAEANFYLSQTYSALGYSQEETLRLARYAIELQPRNANFLMGLGNILAADGKSADAQKMFDEALSCSPLMGAIYWNKSRTLKFTEADQDFIFRMQDLYVYAQMSDTDRIMLGFSLAKAYRDLKAYESAIDCWETANSVQKKKYKFEINLERVRFAKYYRLFPFDREVRGVKDDGSNPTPIFIVGMPRSGTTLTEQIIGSHSRVTPLGELEYLARAVGAAQQKFSDLHSKDALASIRNSYYAEINRHGVTTPMFTDKMPLNFRFLPIIAHAFPEAKIIHCNRDAMAVCFSNFSNYFPAEGLVFTCNQVDVAEYFNLYRDFMELSNVIFKERIYELEYTPLTENQLEETTRLLEHCGLDVEPLCLNFQENKRAIATASQRQIRQGMYTGSTEAWRSFSPWLTPMMSALAQSAEKRIPLKSVG